MRFTEIQFKLQFFSMACPKKSGVFFFQDVFNKKWKLLDLLPLDDENVMLVEVSIFEEILLGGSQKQEIKTQQNLARQGGQTEAKGDPPRQGGQAEAGIWIYWTGELLYEFFLAI